jgi:hypothetical protein
MLAAEKGLKWILGGEGQRETEGIDPILIPQEYSQKLRKLVSELSRPSPSNLSPGRERAP